MAHPRTSYATVEAAAAAANAKVRVCPECAGYFTPVRVDQFRCGNPCSKSYWTRQQARGPSLLPVAMAWRLSRGSAADKFSEMCTLLDRWNADDYDRRKKVETAEKALAERRKKAKS